MGVNVILLKVEVAMDIQLAFARGELCMRVPSFATYFSIFITEFSSALEKVRWMNKNTDNVYIIFPVFLALLYFFVSFFGFISFILYIFVFVLYYDDPCFCGLL